MNRSKQLIVFFIIIGLILLIGIWIGYQFLDPFNRDIIIATIPFDMTFYLVSTFLFVIFNRIFHGLGGLGFIEAKLVQARDVNVHFTDVIGIDEAVEEAQEVVQMVRDRMAARGKPKKRMIRGLLMLGPPGCGKTLLAKAMATEAGLPFLALSGSDFVEKWYSLGAARIRGAFKEAKRLAEQKGACVIFIDELDVIGRMRTFSGRGGEEETNRTLTQLLVEMDGLNAREVSNIIVVGATNASEDILDKALLRPGRFDRKIYIDQPSREGREQLLRHFLAQVLSAPDIDMASLAKITWGKSASDIENIVREAALIAAKENKAKVEFPDLIAALERLDLGLKGMGSMGDEDKLRLAYHEAGHLLAARYFDPEQEIVRVSIKPRKRKFSVVQQVPREELYIRNRDVFMNQIKMRLAGFVAEKVVYGSSSELTRDDFKEATGLARDMVWVYGMGLSGYVGNYLAISIDDISDTFKQHLNNDSEAIIRQCSDSVEELLTRNRPKLDAVAKQLVDTEELGPADIQAIFA